MRNIGIDLDGVFYDFLTPFLKLVNGDLGTIYDINDITKWSLSKSGLITHKQGREFLKKFTEEGQIKKMKPLPGAAASLRVLSQFYKIYFITSRWPDAQIQTIESLDRDLGSKFYEHPVIFCSRDYSKGQAVKELNAKYFVDDKPTNIEQVKKHVPECECIYLNTNELPSSESPNVSHYYVNDNYWNNLYKKINP